MTAKKIKSLTNWRKQEKGMSSVALFILALPLLIVAFGYGFDSLRLVFIKESIQDKVTLAAQSGVAVNYVGSNGLVTLGSPLDGGQSEDISSKLRAYQIYGQNTAEMRENGQILTCQELEKVQFPTNTQCAEYAEIIGEPLTVAQTCTPLSDGNDIRYDNMYGLKYSVNENVKMTFLTIFGVKETADLKNITATALVRARGC